MDAQVFWDPLGTSLVLARRHQRRHGQLRLHAGARAPRRTGTSSCATSSAPRTSPAEAMDAGIEWTWTTFPEYLDAVDAAAQGHQLRGLHRPLRAAHLRDGRARLRAGARPRTICARWSASCATRSRAGAMGFTTSRSPSHETPDAPPGGQPPRHLGRGAAAGRRDGRAERRHLRARRRGRRPRAGDPGAARLPRAAARPGRRDRAARSPSACSAAARRPTSGGRTSPCSTRRPRPAGACSPRCTAARSPRCCRSRPSCRSTACPSGRSSARCRWTSRSAQLRDPRAARTAGRGRARARRAPRVGTEARPADYDWIFVLDSVTGPAPLGGRGRARARPAIPAEAMIDLALEKDLDRFFLQPIANEDQDDRAGDHAPPAHGHDVLRLRRPRLAAHGLLAADAPAEPLGARRSRRSRSSRRCAC